MSLSSYITAVLVLLVVVSGWYFLDQFEEVKVVDILAAREANLGLPIYAQFVATQEINLESRAVVTRLVVPVFFPAEGQELQIDLWHSGRLIQRWRYKPGEIGLVEASLVLEPPWALAGLLEVQFSARGIGHHRAEQAPRLFVESANEQYPGGNYRVAENEKEGDISLAVMERRRVLDRVFTGWQRRPLKVLAQAGLTTMAALLAVSLPGVLTRVVRSGGAKQVIDEDALGND